MIKNRILPILAVLGMIFIPLSIAGIVLTFTGCSATESDINANQRPGFTIVKPADTNGNLPIYYYHDTTRSVGIWIILRDDSYTNHDMEVVIVPDQDYSSGK